MSNIPTLKPFGKGPDPRRNTKGRPVGSTREKTLANRLRRMLGKKVPGYDLTYQEAIADAMIKKSINGSVAAFKAITEITDGKPGKKNSEKATPTIVYEHIDFKTKRRIVRVYRENLDPIRELLKEQGYFDIALPFYDLEKF